MKATKIDIQNEIIEIAHAMNLAKLPKQFVNDAVRVSFEFEGVYDLMKLWAEENEDQDERDAIIADIQDMINECGQTGKKEG